VARSLNKVQLIGNLTRDPELRYTPQGTAVCTLGLATNRVWVSDDGEKHEEAEFHRIVAWNKLAELCAQLLFKGRKVYLEGRLQTRQWTGSDGVQRKTTEIVASEMIILDSRREAEEVQVVAGEVGTAEEKVETVEEKEEGEEKPEQVVPEQTAEEVVGKVPAGEKPIDDKKKAKKKGEEESEEESSEDKEVKKEEIPF